LHIELQILKMGQFSDVIHRTAAGRWPTQPVDTQPFRVNQLVIHSIRCKKLEKRTEEARINDRVPLSRRQRQLRIFVNPSGASSNQFTGTGGKANQF
jgi:hypothetical protein